MTPEQQRRKDDTRKVLLEYELEDEKKKLDLAIRSLDRLEDPGTDSDTHPEVREQVRQHFMLRYQRHTQNIKALRQELARLQ